MIYSVDGLWERLKKRSRRLQLADQTDSDTHLHHSFVTVLIGGGIAAVILTLAQLALPLMPEWSLSEKIGAGCFVANVGYLAREIEARVQMGWRYKLWDGFLDIYVPACFWVPACTGSMAVLYAMLAVYAFTFFLLRPVK